MLTSASGSRVRVKERGVSRCCDFDAGDCCSRPCLSQEFSCALLLWLWRQNASRIIVLLKSLGL